MKISSLPDKEFKVIVIRLLAKLRSMEEHIENFNKDTDNIKKNQTELKNTMTEMKIKNILEGITADHMNAEKMDPKKNNEKILKRPLEQHQAY